MQTLSEFVDSVHSIENKTMNWLGSMYFHRVENRATPIDSSLIFTPADGIIMGAFENLDASESIIDVKGVNLSLKDILQDEEVEGKFCVDSIFMSFYNQHQNYIPFSGYRTYEEISPISTFNKPMLKVEKDLMKKIINPEFQEDYLRLNGREISEIYAPKLEQSYQLVRLGDYDVDVMVNWTQPDGMESRSYQQNDRFGMITFGSQCILIIEQKRGGCKFTLRPDVVVGNVVKCKRDPLINIEYPTN